MTILQFLVFCFCISVTFSSIQICSENQMQFCDDCYQQKSIYCCAISSIGGACTNEETADYTLCSQEEHRADLCVIPPTPETANCTNVQMESCNICKQQKAPYCCNASIPASCSLNNNPIGTFCMQYSHKNNFCRIVQTNNNQNSTYNHTINFINNCNFPIWMGLNGGVAENQGTLCPNTTNTFCVGCSCCPSGKCCENGMNCPNLKCGEMQCKGNIDLVERGGFELGRQKIKSMLFPKFWSGAVWARTECAFFNVNSNDDPIGICDTGSCLDSNNVNHLYCGGVEAEKPFTKIEFSFDGEESKDTDDFDISLVDGYNLPIQIIPIKGSYFKCDTNRFYFPSCNTNLNLIIDVIKRVPDNIRLLYYKDYGVKGVWSTQTYFETLYPHWNNNNTSRDIDLQLKCGGNGEPYSSWTSCRNECGKQQQTTCHSGPPQECSVCDPQTWPQFLPNSAKIFKQVCPNSYSYAYDELCDGAECPIEKRVLFHCTSSFPEQITGYNITFCAEMTNNALLAQSIFIFVVCVIMMTCIFACNIII
jgi:hypothetical protein